MVGRASFAHDRYQRLTAAVRSCFDDGALIDDALLAARELINMGAESDDMFEDVELPEILRDLRRRLPIDANGLRAVAERSARQLAYGLYHDLPIYQAVEYEGGGPASANVLAAMTASRMLLGDRLLDPAECFLRARAIERCIADETANGWLVGRGVEPHLPELVAICLAGFQRAGVRSLDAHQALPHLDGLVERLVGTIDFYVVENRELRAYAERLTAELSNLRPRTDNLLAHVEGRWIEYARELELRVAELEGLNRALWSEAATRRKSPRRLMQIVEAIALTIGLLQGPQAVEDVGHRLHLIDRPSSPTIDTVIAEVTKACAAVREAVNVDRASGSIDIVETAP